MSVGCSSVASSRYGLHDALGLALVRPQVAVGLVGLAGLAIAAWISPARLLAATGASMVVLRTLGLRGAVLFGILQILVAVSGILPASLLGIAAGGIYGLLPGFLLAAVSTMVGAVAAFVLSRSLFRPTVERLMASRPRLRNFDGLIAQDGLRLVCLLRISPVMPFSVTSYMLGLSSIDLRSYTSAPSLHCRPYAAMYSSARWQMRVCPPG
jgi:uncharacterized membrane protein YdjX (TVP38/TMEM64 family)